MTSFGKDLICKNIQCTTLNGAPPGHGGNTLWIPGIEGSIQSNNAENGVVVEGFLKVNRDCNFQDNITLLAHNFPSPATIEIDTGTLTDPRSYMVKYTNIANSAAGIQANQDVILAVDGRWFCQKIVAENDYDDVGTNRYDASSLNPLRTSGSCSIAKNLNIGQGLFVNPLSMPVGEASAAVGQFYIESTTDNTVKFKKA